jgi:hypothetical protein
MYETIIPAQAGFVAKWLVNGEIKAEPIIAWSIEYVDQKPRVTPIGVYGWCDSKAVIVDPNGKAVPV